MIPRIRTLARLITVVCIALGTSVAARAQTGRPDFNPGADDHGPVLGCRRTGRSWSVASSRCSAAAGPARRRATDRPAQRRRLARHGFNPGANDDSLAMALQADGKILVGGSFTTLGGGGTGTTTRNISAGSTRTARSTRASIPARTAPSRVGGAGGREDPGRRRVHRRSVAAAPARRRATCIGRLNADGSLDTSFDPGANVTTSARSAVQPDGKILVGGDFTMLGGGGTGTTPRNHIGRLNADGSLDTGFDPGANMVSRP